jgi:S-adenosylmethionine-diacylglycerol 3-amino-3-carboxypropyl transferase
VNHNFFFRFFFFGPTQLPESMLPPCYQSQNYALLRSQLDRLTIVDGEAVDYLLSADGRSITKASLSNIFEYTSQEEFRQVCASLLAGQDRQLRFIFWNLLQEQGHLPDSPDWTETLLSDQITHDNACFYFRDVRVLATQPILAKAVN